MLDIEVKKKTMKDKMNKTYKIVKPHAWNDTSFSRNLFPLPFRQRVSRSVIAYAAEELFM